MVRSARRRPQTGEAGHHRQPRNTRASLRQQTNASYPESQPSDALPNHASHGLEGLQSAEKASDNVQMALNNARLPANQPYPSEAVAFSREGLRSADIALKNVREALTNLRARPQLQRHVSVNIQAEDSISVNNMVSTSDNFVTGHPALSFAPSGPVSIIPPFRVAHLSEYLHQWFTKGTFLLTLYSQTYPDSMPETTSKSGVKRKASQVSDADDASHGQKSKYLKTETEHASAKQSPSLPGVVAQQVDVNGTSVPLVPIPKHIRRTVTRHGITNQAIVRVATNCLLQFPGFEFAQYINSGMQGMAPLIDALEHRMSVKRHKCYETLYRFFTSICLEMLSQRALYAGVIDCTTKESFFSHIHHVHYSILIHNHESLKPKQRAKPNLMTESWADLDVNVLTTVVEAVIAAREAFLQNLAARRDAATTTQANLQWRGQQDTKSCRPVRDEDPVSPGIKETRVKSETGLAASDMDDLGYKPEPEDDSIRLHDIPEYKAGNDGNGWLDDLESEDEHNVPRPPSQGRGHRAARRKARERLGEMRMRTAVDRWTRFTRAV